MMRCQFCGRRSLVFDLWDCDTPGNTKSCDMRERFAAVPARMVRKRRAAIAAGRHNADRSCGTKVPARRASRAGRGSSPRCRKERIMRAGPARDQHAINTGGRGVQDMQTRLIRRLRKVVRPGCGICDGRLTPPIATRRRRSPDCTARSSETCTHRSAVRAAAGRFLGPMPKISEVLEESLWPPYYRHLS